MSDVRIGSPGPAAVLVTPEDRVEAQCVGSALQEAGFRTVSHDDPSVRAVVALALPGAPATALVGPQAQYLPLVVLAAHDDAETQAGAAAAGAVGLVAWSHDTSVLVETLRGILDLPAAPPPTAPPGAAVPRGGPAVLRRRPAPGPPARTAPRLRLSGLDRMVADKMAEGATNTAIARSLGLSERKVREHVRDVMFKLAVRNRRGVPAGLRAYDDAMAGPGPR